MLADDILLDRSTIEAALTQVRMLLRRAYVRPDAYHGPEHAEEVLRLADDISRRIPGGLQPVEHLIVSTAALLHDVGYTAYQPDWAPNRNEHVAASIAFAQRQLALIAPFAEHPRLIDAVNVLIAYHDDTSYKFPSFVWDGRVGSIDLGPSAAQLAAFEASLSPEQRERLRLLLAILREADALTAAGSAGAERTFQYAIHRGLPAFARGNPLNAWCWEESAAGNTRLAAKRALIDAFTPEGKRAAWESYRATEAYLQGVCTEHGISYVPESIATFGEPSDPRAIGPLAVGTVGSADVALELISFAGWDALERTMRDAAPAPVPGLQSQSSTITRMSPCHLPLDLLPDLSQAMDSDAPHAAALASLHAHLLAEYALSLFDLAGIVEYRVDGTVMRALPPVVVRHPGGTVAGSADMHDISSGAVAGVLARKLGVSKLWVVEVVLPGGSGWLQSVRETGGSVGAITPHPPREGQPRRKVAQ